MTQRYYLVALTALFFISGSAGLIYQVSWQRLLYATFGSDVESVTIIVAAFMLGLGLGALLGGKLADLYSEKTLMLFCLCELGIGVYGFLSYQLILFVGDLFIQQAIFVIAIINFMLVLLPALLMGATLPILIHYIVMRWHNVGRATGHLYAVNTFGATLGASITGYYLFHYLEINQVIMLAATINITVSLIAFLIFRVRGVK